MDVDDLYPKYFDESEGKVVYAVEPRSEPFTDIASLAGFYHWVVEVVDPQFDRLSENVTSYDPSHRKFKKGLGYFQLSFPRGTKKADKTADTIQGKLAWKNSMYSYIGSFDGATPTGKWPHTPTSEYTHAKWTTDENWEWEKYNDECFDEGGHDFGVANVVDDTGHPFLIVDLWCGREGGHDSQTVTVIGKKHLSSKVENQGLTEAEKWRLGMGLTEEQVEEGQGGESSAEDEEGVEDVPEDEEDVDVEPDDEEEVDVEPEGELPDASSGQGKRVRQTARKSTGGRPPKRVKK